MMNFKLKLQDPAWVEIFTNLENSNKMREVYLKGGSGSQVAVPTILLVAVSPLARNIVAPDQAPQYQPPVITVPSISGEALQKMVEILSTGKGSVTVSMLGEIQDIFKMFGIEAGLVCSEPQSGREDESAEQDMVISISQLGKKTEDTDLNENCISVKSLDIIKQEYMETANLKIVVKVEDSDFPGYKAEYSCSENSDLILEEVQSRKALDANFQSLESDNLRSVCGICFKDFKDLFHHVKTVHERVGRREKILCPDCQKYISCRNYTRHRKESHEKIRTPCPECGKSLTSSNLSAHIRSVHQKIKIRCDVCGKEFDQVYLKAHIKTVHKIVD